MADSVADRIDPARRSWLPLLFVVAAHFVFNLLANPIGVASSGPLNWLGGMFFGAMLAQPVLLAEWAVFGPGAAVRRVPLTTFASVVIACGGYYTGWSYLKGTRASDWNELEYLYIWVFTLPIAAIVMMLVQILTHWKIIRPTSPSGASLSSNQFSLKYLLGLTAVCAALLGTARALGSHHWPGISTSWMTGAAGFLVGLSLALLAIFPAFTVPLLALTHRPTVQMIIGVPLAWAALSWLAVETVVAIEPKEVRSNVAHDIAFLQAGAAIAGLLSALIVRFAGYRLMIHKLPSPAPAVAES